MVDQVPFQVEWYNFKLFAIISVIEKYVLTKFFLQQLPISVSNSLPQRYIFLKTLFIIF